jgi:hypothetical protein
MISSDLFTRFDGHVINYKVMRGINVKNKSCSDYVKGYNAGYPSTYKLTDVGPCPSKMVQISNLYFSGRYI